MDDRATHLLNVFLDELEERVDALDRDLLKLEAEPSSADRVELIVSLLREAHSLKGAAASVGATEIERTSHTLEDMLTAVRDSRLNLDASHIDVLFRSADALRAGGRTLRQGVLTPAVPDAAERVPVRRDGTVRVAVDKLDRLLEQSGELLIAHHRTESRLADIRAIGEVVRNSGIRRSRDIDRALERLGDAIAADNLATERSARRVNAEIRSIRMFPFASAVEGLDRIVRDAANASGKRVRFEVHGHDIEIDRSVLGGLRDPLVHLVRNAIDHGIESPDRRAALGKSQEGVVAVSAGLRGGNIEVTVTDDGAGLDLDAIRRHATERGFSVEDDDAVRAAFLSGVSTAQTVTSLSGRGVGLNAVRSAIDALRGSIAVSSEQGTGTRFVLALPLTLTALRAILFQIAGQTFALDSSVIIRVARVDPRDVSSVEGRPVILFPDRPVPLIPLRTVLGRPEEPPDSTSLFPVIIVRANDRAIALRVDALLDEREVLIRTLGPRMSAARAVAGASILADGSIALIARSAFVIERSLHLAKTLRAAAQFVSTAPKRKRLLLVDDSITTRTLECSILEGAGYEVCAMPDAESAWQALNESEYDLVVSDVDMPGIDGFALVEKIRTSNHVREMPIVLVTGRESDSDKRRGIEVGADAYVVKSGFDQKALLATVADLL